MAHASHVIYNTIRQHTVPCFMTTIRPCPSDIIIPTTRLRAMKGKLGNAMNVLAGKMKVQADFHNVVGQVRTSTPVPLKLKATLHANAFLSSEKMPAANKARARQGMDTHGVIDSKDNPGARACKKRPLRRGEGCGQPQSSVSWVSSRGASQVRWGSARDGQRCENICPAPSTHSDSVRRNLKRE